LCLSNSKIQYLNRELSKHRINADKAGNSNC
jgi:hypothetical protein